MAIKGHLGTFSKYSLSGWVYDSQNVKRKLTVYLKVGERVVTSSVAEIERPDLVTKKIGDGRCAFNIKLPTLLSDHEYQHANVGVEGETFSFPNLSQARQKAKRDLPPDIELPVRLRTLEEVVSNLDKDKKTVAFTSFGPYKDQYGRIWEKLHKKNKYNVINLCTKFTGHEFDHFENTAFIAPNALKAYTFIDYAIASNQPVHHFPKNATLINFQHELLDFASSVHYDYHMISTRLLMRHAKLTLLNGLNARNLPDKPINLLPAGYVKVDNLSKAVEATTDSMQDTIIIAPTYKLKGVTLEGGHIIPNYLAEITRRFLKEYPNYRIYVRFHPAAINYYPDWIPEFEKQFSSHDSIAIDRGYGDILPEYRRARFLITDYSGTAYTFAFSTRKPVIFFSPKEDRIAPIQYEAGEAFGYFAGANYLSMRSFVGDIATSYDELIKKSNELLGNCAHYRNGIEQVRKLLLYNFGCVEEYMVNSLEAILDGNSPNGYLINKRVAGEAGGC